MTTEGQWPPLDPWEYDNPSSVRLVDTAPQPGPQGQAHKRIPDDGARLGRPWERRRRESLEAALEAAGRMADDVEVFLGELGIFAPQWVTDYHHLYDEAIARITRLQKLGEHL